MNTQNYENGEVSKLKTLQNKAEGQMQLDSSAIIVMIM